MSEEVHPSKFLRLVFIIKILVNKKVYLSINTELMKRSNSIDTIGYERKEELPCYTSGYHF